MAAQADVSLLVEWWSLDRVRGTPRITSVNLPSVELATALDELVAGGGGIAHTTAEGLIVVSDSRHRSLRVYDVRDLVERPGDDAAAREKRVARLAKRCGYAALAYWDTYLLKEWQGFFVIEAIGEDHSRFEALFQRLRSGSPAAWLFE